MRVLIIMFVVSLLVVAICQARLPAEAATHFGLSGAADGWGPRSGFTVLMAGLDVLVFLVFVLIPRLVFWLPPDLVNLPNREYWLSPERRDQTRGILAHEMGIFGAAVLCFTSAAALLTLKANLDGSQHLDMPMFAGALGAFLGFTGLWCVHLYRVFRIPAERAAAAPLEPR